MVGKYTEYILTDVKKKKLAKSTSIVEIRKKAYNIALKNALTKNKKTEKGAMFKYQTSNTYKIIKEEYFMNSYGYKEEKEIGYVIVSCITPIHPYAIEKDGKKTKIDATYYLYPFNYGKEYVLNKNGSIVEKRK